MDRADGNRIIQQVTTELADPTDGTVTGQRQPENQLIEPILRHGEIEKNPIGASFPLAEHFVEGIAGLVALPVDELSADFMFGGQPADRCSSRQSMQRQVLPLLRPHRHRRIENRGFALRKKAGDAKIRIHVCFLHETG